MAKEKKNARIEVFRVGTFTPMNGTPLTFSESDLQAVVDNYDAENAPAPIVVGHPKTDDPAFGWAGAFDFDADTGVLHADLKDIAPSFADAVDEGQYKKVSMAFFQPNAAANPKPGTFYPKHIGFLGAVPPAVPGLTPVSFADHSEDDVVMFEGTINFGSFDAENIGTLFRNMREWMIVKFGKETADEVVPSWRIDWVNDLELNTDDDPAYAADATTPEKTPKKEPVVSKEQEAEFAAREKAIADGEAKLAADREAIDEQNKLNRAADNAAFAETLIADEKLIPASKDKVVSLLNAAGDAGATVSFAEGEDAVDLAQGIRSVLADQPKIVNFGAHEMGEDPDGDAGGKAVNFATADGASVDPESAAWHNKAQRYIADHPGTNYMDAVRAVQTQ